LSFRWLKQGLTASLCFAFSWRAGFLGTDLADLLFARRRSRDGFATGIGGARLDSTIVAIDMVNSPERELCGRSQYPPAQCGRRQPVGNTIEFGLRVNY
jgi:hypothetical protein